MQGTRARFLLCVCLLHVRYVLKVVGFTSLWPVLILGPVELLDKLRFMLISFHAPSYHPLMPPCILHPWEWSVFRNTKILESASLAGLGRLFNSRCDSDAMNVAMWSGFYGMECNALDIGLFKR